MTTLARLRQTRGLSIVMITHDLQLTGSLFDLILALCCGSVAAKRTAAKVLSGEVLSHIFDDPKVRAKRVGTQTVAWIES